MEGVPLFVWLVVACGLVWLGVYGLRGLLTIHQAFQAAELDRIAPPPQWPATRALIGVFMAMPVFLVTRHLGSVAPLVALACIATGYGLAPHLLRGARRRLESRLLDDLALHLDVLAVAIDAGSSWSSALALCMERVPDGPLRRAWQRVLVDIHGGLEPLDALRALEQRLRLQPFTTLVSALRAAEKLKLPAAGVLRDRARHCSAARFARAERRARAAPLKIWAAMLLCLLPCTVVVLAYPAAWLLSRLVA